MRPRLRAFAQDFEKPRSFQANQIPGIAAGGQNYTIKSPVTSDGFMRIYVFTTPWGEFSAIGDGMMRQRQRELAALGQLQQVTESDHFNRALAEAGISPIKFAGDLIVNPLGTLGNTLSGIGSLFGQVGSSAHNAGKYESDPMADLTGASRKKRELAVKLGVDPYTDFQPLQQRLTQLSAAAATGGLVVSGALMAIPGVGGIIVSNTATSANLGNAARDNTPAQLLDINRPKLLAMGVDRNLAEQFLLNRNYTPVDATAIVGLLEEVQVPGREVFFARAATVGRRDAAVFMRRQAEMLADYQNKTALDHRLCGARRLPLRHDHRRRARAASARRLVVDARDRQGDARYHRVAAGACHPAARVRCGSPARPRRSRSKSCKGSAGR